MRYKAFLLGLFSIASQVLILRELMATYGGSELYIGSALFGWMLSAAIGALIGGNKRFNLPPVIFFVIGGLLLPVIVLSARFSPLVFSDIVGETIPFSKAVPISILIMFPIGLISGWLFPAINKSGYKPSQAVINTYLYEGFGAFIGGLIIMLLVGTYISTIAMALLLGLSIIFAPLITKSRAAQIFVGAIIVLTIVAAFTFSSDIEHRTASHQFGKYTVVDSFETPYSRQTIIEKDSTTFLLTDNAVESIWPDPESIEKTIIPPLIYKPDAKKLLIIGRLSPGLDQVSKHFESTEFHFIDIRKSLSEIIREKSKPETNVFYHHADPTAFMIHPDNARKYDIVVLDIGYPSNFRIANYYTPEFLSMIRNVLKSGGLVYIPTPYDTDRYILQDKQKILSAIYYNLSQTFNHINIWPGNSTLFFASDDPGIAASTATIIEMAESLSYNSQHFDIYFLNDRLNDFKIDRLHQSLNERQHYHTGNTPTLPVFQEYYNSQTNNAERFLLNIIMLNPMTASIIVSVILLILVVALFRRKRHRYYGLFLYLIAGLVSLWIELLVFYIYQSTSGSLYSDMGVLIGVFMLGLAIGTYYSDKIDMANIETPALLLIISSTVIYIMTCENIDQSVALLINALFLLTCAIATGTIFVGATRRYYFGRAGANRGVGYSLEIVGSSIGALGALTICLPLLGITWSFVIIIILSILTLIGAILSS